MTLILIWCLVFGGAETLGNEKPPCSCGQEGALIANTQSLLQFYQRLNHKSE